MASRDSENGRLKRHLPFRTTVLNPRTYHISSSVKRGYAALGLLLAVLGVLAVVQPPPASEMLAQFGPSVRLVGLCFLLIAAVLGVLGWWLAGIRFVVEGNQLQRITRLGTNEADLANLRGIHAPFGGMIGLRVRPRSGTTISIPIETSDLPAFLDDLAAAYADVFPQQLEPRAIGKVRRRVTRAKWRRDCMAGSRFATSTWTIAAIALGASAGAIVPNPWTIDYFRPGWIVLGGAIGLFAVIVSMALVLGRYAEAASQNASSPAREAIGKLAMRRALQASAFAWVMLVALPSFGLWMHWHAEADAIEHVREMGGEITIIPAWVHEHREVNLTRRTIDDGEMPNLIALGSLDDLNLNGCIMTDDQLVRICDDLRIGRLQLRHTRISGAGIGRIDGARNLQTLMLSWSNLNNSAMATLPAMSSLEHLDLGGTRITDVGLNELHGMPALVNLNISGTHIEGASLASVASMPMLQQLDAVNTRIDDGDVQLLAQSASIQRLNLSKTLVTDRAFDPLGKLSSLTHLKLGHTRVQGRGAAALLNCPHLVQLDVSFTMFDDPATHAIAEMPSLLALDLERTQVSDAGLIHIGRIDGLQSLNLAHTSISDEGLGRLSQMHELRSINLKGTNVTADGLKAIAKLASLEKVNVEQTGISEAFANAFVLDLPRVKARKAAE